MRIPIRSIALASLMLFGMHPASQALLVGPSPGENPTTELRWNDTGTNYELELTDVSIGGSAPYWIKQLTNQGTVDGVNRPVITEGETITLVEHLEISGNVPLVDWREIFSSDGWSFADAAVYYGGTDDLVDGLEVTISPGDSGPLDVHDDNLLLHFDAIAPGTIIRIEKTLRYDGIDVTVGSEQWGGDNIIMRQFPDTVIPEPAVIGMVALGSGMYGLVRRRRKADPRSV